VKAGEPIDELAASRMADQPNRHGWAFECLKLLDQLNNEIARPCFAWARRTLVETGAARLGAG
jgi:hypothetical protein